ncbi:MAG: hypothetical protein HQK75_18095 [Candidatus Magnetomorum sp.]|nr:hypothetical protein [Candidatus Magnetomorum sp.]
MHIKEEPIKTLMNTVINFDDVKELFKETDKKFHKTDKQLREIGQQISKLKDIVGGIGNNNGFVAEQLFYNSLSKSMSLGNLTFDSIDRNLERTRRGLKDEFDIILTNSNILIIVEVKYNFHPNDVKKILTKINNFKQLFPIYSNYKVLGAVAALAMPQETIDIAKEYGFYVLTQDGNDIKILIEPSVV